MEKVTIGESDFLFINGLPIGWFVDGNPVFYPMRSVLYDRMMRGGVSVAVTVKDSLSTEQFVPALLGGMAQCCAKKHVYTKGYADGKSGASCNLYSIGKAVFPQQRCSWGLRYEIKTSFREKSLRMKVILKRIDSGLVKSKLFVNLSIATYFYIGSVGFVTSNSGKGFIFATEERPNMVTPVDCQIETAGADISMQTGGAKGFFLFSQDFDSYGCIQALLDKPRGFGGSGGVELAVGEEVGMVMTLKNIND
jgi:hypothetical protein